MLLMTSWLHVILRRRVLEAPKAFAQKVHLTANAFFESQPICTRVFLIIFLVSNFKCNGYRVLGATMCSLL